MLKKIISIMLLVLNLEHIPLYKHFCKCPHVEVLTLYSI